MFSFGKIKERFQIEFQSNTNKSLSSNVIKGIPQGFTILVFMKLGLMKNLHQTIFFSRNSIQSISSSNIFRISSRRAYFWKGFGLNAALKKTEEKGKNTMFF